jgi:transposase/DNA-binding CsgD family transcriptional regulator
VLTPDLFPGAGLRLDDLVLTPNTTFALLVATAPSAPCPRCGAASDRIHSRYRRTVADLPCQGRPVALRLVVRRFRCIDPCCPQVIFCERLPALLDARARTTARLTDAHRAIGFALGGEAGSRLAAHLDMPISSDTLLRRVKNCPDEPAPPPRYVGIDDWAFRRGQRYGTVVVDLERGRVIDLLPDREAATAEAWLRQHPGVEVITRDRAAAYAQGASAGAPGAVQVADRWHLLKNLREALERLFGRLDAAVADALRPPAPDEAAPTAATLEAAPGAPEPQPRPAAPGPATPSAPETAASVRQAARQARRQQRAARHAEVRVLCEQGLSLRQIARQTGLSRNAVRRYCRQARCPDWNPGRRGRTGLDGFADHIEQWLAAGGRNSADLFRDLQARGCAVGYDAVRRYVSRRLGSAHRPGPRTAPCAPPPPPRPSARQLSFEFVKRAEKRQAEEQARVDRLRTDPVLREALEVAESFVALVRKQATASLSDWLAQAEQSGCGEIVGFAAGLRQDEAAVRAALTTPWSNGPVEGQVNRLKTIKRQMYGRAGFQLLRARVLGAA